MFAIFPGEFLWCEVCDHEEDADAPDVPATPTESDPYEDYEDTCWVARCPVWLFYTIMTIPYSAMLYGLYWVFKTFTPN